MPMPSAIWYELGAWPSSAQRRRGWQAGRRGEHKQRDRAFVIDDRPLADPGDRGVRRNLMDQHQIERNAGVPADKDAGRHAPGQSEQQEHNNDTEYRREQQPRM